MEKIRAVIERYVNRLDHRWRQLPLHAQQRYTLCFFIGYLLLTAAITGKVIYDTSGSGDGTVIEPITTPITKKDRVPALLRDSVSTILKNQMYERN